MIMETYLQQASHCLCTCNVVANDSMITCIKDDQFFEQSAKSILNFNDTHKLRNQSRISKKC